MKRYKMSNNQTSRNSNMPLRNNIVRQLGTRSVRRHHPLKNSLLLTPEMILTDFFDVRGLIPQTQKNY